MECIAVVVVVNIVVGIVVVGQAGKVNSPYGSNRTAAVAQAPALQLALLESQVRPAHRFPSELLQ